MRLLEIVRTVAPYAGAWIEIRILIVVALVLPSLPTRERGLKWHRLAKGEKNFESLPTRERGLKSFVAVSNAHNSGRSLRGSVD